MSDAPAASNTPQARYSLSQRAVLAIFPPVAAGLMKSIATTCTFERHNQETFDRMRTEGRFLVAAWHESLGIGIQFYPRYSVCSLISQSYDGELAARTVAHWGIRCVRGSSSRGGSEALIALADKLDEGIVGWTLDGPRGPRRVAKPGIAVLAWRMQVPILPHAFSATPCWRLNSWDRFMVPKPFGRMIASYGTPVPPPATGDPDAIEATRRAVEDQLNALHAAIDSPE